MCVFVLVCGYVCVCVCVSSCTQERAALDSKWSARLANTQREAAEQHKALQTELDTKVRTCIRFILVLFMSACMLMLCVSVCTRHRRLNSTRRYELAYNSLLCFLCKQRSCPWRVPIRHES